MPRAGRISVGGRLLRGGDPREAIRAGVAHVPEDRLGTGLAPSLSVTSNAVIKTYRRRSLSHGPLLDLRRMRDAALGIIRRYDVQTPGPETPVRNLSGGNLQKLVLGREFSDEPLVLVVAQPTRGLDVGAIETVHAYLRDAAAKGVAILLMSEDLDELRALADRILVDLRGRGRRRARRRRGQHRGDRATSWPADAARDPARAQAEQPWWLSVAVPVGSLLVAFGIMGIVLAASGHAPARPTAGSSRRASPATAPSRRRSSPRPRSSSPGWRRRRRSACSSSTSGPRASSTSARSARRGSRSSSATTARPRSRSSSWPCVPPRHPRCALGAHPGRAPSLREHERDHHVADAQLRRGLPAYVPHLRQLVLLARCLEPAGALLPAGEADAVGGRVGDVRVSRDRPARLPRRSPGRRRRSGSCTPGRASASR